MLTAAGYPVPNDREGPVRALPDVGLGKPRGDAGGHPMINAHRAAVAWCPAASGRRPYSAARPDPVDDAHRSSTGSSTTWSMAGRTARGAHLLGPPGRCHQPRCRRVRITLAGLVEADDAQVYRGQEQPTRNAGSASARPSDFELGTLPRGPEPVEHRTGSAGLRPCQTWWAPKTHA
jgi:hypothetical protein